MIKIRYKNVSQDFIVTFKYRVCFKIFLHFESIKKFTKDIHIPGLSWNTLPNNIKCAINTDCFKKLLKTHLLNA